MTRARIKTAQLVRLLNSTEQPLYLLDDQRTIVFCNEACTQWIGVGAEELLGAQCGYHSSSEDAESGAIAARLCPTPDAIAGRSSTGTVAMLDRENRLHRRTAQFIPLGDSADEPDGMICLVDCEDLDPEAADQDTPAGQADEAAWLHDRLQVVRHLAVPRYEIDRFLGNSPAMCLARDQIRVAADSRARVFIVGPPGSGRRHAASAIHYGADSENAGSLIPLACSLLGPELLDSTLNTFLTTGDPRPERPGRSTLLLNDVDQLSDAAQHMLATTLVERKLPLRLIATSATPLDRLVEQGAYRANLAAIFSTITICLPPLADRRTDLPILAQMFVENINAKGDKQLAGFTSEALDRLDAYHWPGNVDELAHLVADAHANAEGPRIDVADLPDRIDLSAKAAAYPAREEETIVLDEFLAEIERELIERALAQSKGNKTQAAKLLGMTRPRLYRRLVQLGWEE